MELNEDQLRFYGDTELSAEIMSLETPSQFFSFFFSEELIAKTCKVKKDCRLKVVRAGLLESRFRSSRRNYLVFKKFKQYYKSQ